MVVEHGWIFSPVLISHAKKGLESSCRFLSRSVWSLSCKPSVFFSQLYARCCTFVYSFIDRLIGWVIYLLIYLCFGFYVSFYLAYLFVCLFIYFRFVPENSSVFPAGRQQDACKICPIMCEYSVELLRDTVVMIHDNVRFMVLFVVAGGSSRRKNSHTIPRLFVTVSAPRHR